MWLTKAHTSQEAPTSISGSSSLGMITTFVNVPLISSFQKNVEIEYQSRFFSLLSFFSGGLIPLEVLYAGYLSSYIGADITYIINNMAIIVIVFLVFRKNKKYL
ncbi:hypothetical protein FUSPEROL_02265 [Fusobacterium periodonticum ATCC 33693]|uniref:Uncharacterized protein n=1 Tax=Fusobacterium periodonticum ATCC 33693 TaxID=546275 RepID=D4CXR8_9FUSO|nr:hypothetical protein [Fusobacterium periodonticum]EFE85907.1 hypothetical protein FUSPEROL_02265 [Fusobacterium periodonticum ATCC 33693]